MRYKICKHKQAGFTLLELMLVVAMMGLIVMFGVTLSSNFLWWTDLGQAQHQSVVNLRRAQLLAQAMVNDSDWGVHFEDSQSIIFQGNDFGTRDTSVDEVYDLSPVVVSFPIDIIYHKFSGRPYWNFFVVVNFVVDIEEIAITINGEGMIDY